jgi:hypothetical protein
MPYLLDGIFLKLSTKYKQPHADNGKIFTMLFNFILELFS